MKNNHQNQTTLISNLLNTKTMKILFTFFIAIFTSAMGFAQTELLVNPNFTSENSGWTVTQDFKYNTQYSQYNFDAGYAYLPQNDHAYGILSQAVTIPSNASQCTFSFYYKITSDEVSSTTAYDICIVQIADDYSNVYEFTILSNLNESDNYQYRSFTVPSAFFGKNIRFRFIGDNDGAKPTIFRIDNCSVKATVASTAQPDLVISSANMSNSNVQAGNVISLSATTGNNSNASAGSHYFRMYLSTNSTLDAMDTPIYEQYINGIAPITSIAANYNYTIPSLTAGTYYILFVADVHNQVAESNEQNNIGYLSFAVQATPTNFIDLIISSSSCNPTSVSAGNTITVSSVIKNNGNTSSNMGELWYYLSNDAYESIDDIMLGASVLNGTLAAGTSSTQTKTLTIPSNTASGTKYILQKIDGWLDITESNENNNWSAVALTINTAPASLPDLTVTSSTLTPNTITTAGNTILLTHTTKNIGAATANGFIVKYYLSPSTSYNPTTAVLLSTNSYGSLSAGNSQNSSVYLTIPSGQTAGTKYILVYVDANTQISESNENNNIGMATLTVNNPTTSAADLVITSFSCPTNGYTGQSVQVNTSVQNLGGTTANNFVVSFHLSADATYDGGDQFIGEYPINSLSANQINTFVHTLTIPSSAIVGNRYLIASVDGGLVVTESNENNNRLYDNISILQSTVQRLDLNPTKSHLYWPFYNSQDNQAINPPSEWLGQTAGTTYHNDTWHFSNDHDLNNNGEDDHHLGENYFSQDWNYKSTDADCGMSFYAPMDGKVILYSNGYSNITNCVNVNYGSSAGNFIIIQSSDNSSFAFKACHFKQLNPNLGIGSIVRAGDLIGYIGNTGRSSGSHVHCNLLKNLTSSDVSTLVNYGRLGDEDNDYTHACDFNFDAILDGVGGDGGGVTAINSETLGAIKLFPNPAKDWITVELEDEFLKGNLQVLNIFGQVVYEEMVTSSKIILATNTFSNGHYILHIQSDNGTYSGKFIIQH